MTLRLFIHNKPSLKLCHRYSGVHPIQAELHGGDVAVKDHMAKASTAKKKALLIGINYWAYGPKSRWLSEPWRDVKTIRELLIDVSHYDPEDIIVMTDALDTPEDLKPTKCNIIQQMRTLVRDPKEGDDFFVYYAGHAGQRDEEKPGKERDNKEEYIVPLDAMKEDGRERKEFTISDHELRDLLVQPLIYTNVDCQLIAVMDACTSGTLLNLEHDLCNQVIGLESLFFRTVRSLLEFSPNANSRCRARISEWLKDPRYNCNRFCNRKISGVKANITCISACEDSQTLIEGVPGDTLAGILDKYLRDKDKPRDLKTLNRYIYGKFKERHIRLWKDYKAEKEKFKRDERPNRPPIPPREWERPQISSTRPLWMSTPTLKL